MIAHTIPAIFYVLNVKYFDKMLLEFQIDSFQYLINSQTFRLVSMVFLDEYPIFSFITY